MLLSWPLKETQIPSQSTPESFKETPQHHSYSPSAQTMCSAMQYHPLMVWPYNTVEGGYTLKKSSWSYIICWWYCSHEEHTAEADELLHRVERVTQPISLLLNSAIERAGEFLYLESSTNTAHDVDSRIGKAWGASNLTLTQTQAVIINRTSTQIRVFKTSVESILLS